MAAVDLGKTNARVIGSDGRRTGGDGRVAEDAEGHRGSTCMIEGRDFVVVCDHWHGSPTSAMHLFGRISRQNRLFWINVVNRMPRLNWTDLKRTARLIRAWSVKSNGVFKPSDDHGSYVFGTPHIVTPLMLPCFKRTIRRFNRTSLHRTYTRVAAEHDIRSPVFIAVYPCAIDLMHSVGAALNIYYCVDSWLEFPWVNRADWQHMESELLDAVDGLVVTGRALEQKNRRGCPMLYLPQGVDFGHFRSARSSARGLAPVPRMESIPRPIVGFFGVVGPWMDLDLLARLGKAFPDVSFVFIGRPEISLSALESFGNIYFLGQVPYSELPGFARYFDVGLIPFSVNNLTLAVNPVKLLEYYALGLPVLATRLPELETVGGPIWLASNPAEFCDALGTILSQDRGARATEAVEIARRNTWERRVAQLCTFIEDIDRTVARPHGRAK